MVPAPSLGRGMGNSQCCRQGTGGATTAKIFTSLLTRKTMCIPQMQSFSQCSPLASMTAPLAPPHGRRASWQVGELEFPSPAYFHPFQSWENSSTLGYRDTADTSQDNPRLLAKAPMALGPSSVLGAARTWHLESRRNPNNLPGAAPGAHTHELPALQHNPQGAQTPCVCFADGKVLTNAQSRDSRQRRVLCKYNIIYWFHFRARVVFVRVS